MSWPEIKHKLAVAPTFGCRLTAKLWVQSCGRFRLPHKSATDRVTYIVWQRRARSTVWAFNRPSGGSGAATVGHQVVQFKDCASNRFVTVAVDGKVTEYGVKRN